MPTPSYHNYSVKKKPHKTGLNKRDRLTIHTHTILIRHITVLKNGGMSKAALSLSVSRKTAGRMECLGVEKKKKRRRLKHVPSWAHTQVHGM